MSASDSPSVENDVSMTYLLGIGLGRNPFLGRPYRFRQMIYGLREFESPRGAGLVSAGRGDAKRAETLTD